jgi:dihydrofolate reductase
MRPLRFAINVTLDGCCDHEVGIPDEELHNYWATQLAAPDALIFGRVTYQMMEEAWRRLATGGWPDWMDDWMIPFAETIDAKQKYVVSSTLDQVDWNATLIRGDLAEAVQQLKDEPGGSLSVSGLTLGRALTDLGLIDEYVFVVQPIVAGHGPTLFAGLHERLDLTLVERHEFESGSVALRYQAGRASA